MVRDGTKVGCDWRHLFFCLYFFVLPRKIFNNPAHELERLSTKDGKMRKQLFLACVFLLLTGCAVIPKPTDSQMVEESSPLYPDVIVSRLRKVIDGDTFRCDIDEYSAIAGKDISIRIRGVNTPELRDKDPEIRKSAYAEKEHLEQLLSNARIIELRNLGRDKYFRIDADIYIDGEPLLPQLNQQFVISKCPSK